MFPRPTIALLAAALLGAAAATSIGVAARNGPGAPPIIAVIDLERVNKGLTERTERKAELEKRLTDEQKRVDDLKDQLKAEVEKLEAMPDGSARSAQADKIRELRARYQFEVEFTQAQLAKVEFEVFRSIYFKIDQACDQLARKSGYGMILVNDAAAEIKAETPDAFMAAISRRRTMYCDKSLDVTEELITFMNNAFEASKVKGP